MALPKGPKADGVGPGWREGWSWSRVPSGRAGTWRS